MLASILRLIRWQNLLFTAFVVWLMEKMVATSLLDRALFGEQLPAYIFYLLMLSIVFIAAGGYAINDYFDVKIDSINRPDKLIVTRTLTKQDSMLTHQVMTAIGVILGIIIAIILHSWTLAIIYVFVPGILWFYSASYKRQFLVGNILIALSVAIVPLMVAIANVAYLNKTYTQEVMNYSPLSNELYTWIGGFSLFAFLLTLAREITKDLQDQSGDRELECHSLPIVIGDVWTKVIVTLIDLLAIGCAAYFVFYALPFKHTWSSMCVRYFSFGLVVPMICELYLLWSARVPSDYRFAQQMLKFIMLVGVLFSIIIRINL